MNVNTVNKLIFLMLAGMIFLAIASSCFKPSEDQIAIKKTEHTTITPHLEEPISPTNNLLYCASFQMAWNKMRDEVIKEDIRLDADPALAQRLNKKLQDSSDISPGSYLAEVGELSEDLIARINNELQAKFGEQVGDEFKIQHDTTGPRQIVAYAFLYKKLEFPTEFEKLSSPIAFVAAGQKTQVQAFGIESFTYSKHLHEKLSDQAAIFDYRDDNDFILLLTTKSTDDQIILAKVAPGKNLLLTFMAINHRMEVGKKSNLRENETLQIPKINFDLTHGFTDLENKRIMNTGWAGWYISKAVQDTRFKLDEKGALLKSRGILGAMMGAPPPSEQGKPRNFVFDKPFLICLKQKSGKYPYLAIWVNNSELLIKK